MTGRARSANGLRDTPQGMLDDEWIDEKLLDEVESILGLKEFSSPRSKIESFGRRMNATLQSGLNKRLS